MPGCSNLAEVHVLLKLGGCMETLCKLLPVSSRRLELMISLLSTLTKGQRPSQMGHSAETPTAALLYPPITKNPNNKEGIQRLVEEHRDNGERSQHLLSKILQ